MDMRARRHGRAAWLVALPIAAASWLSAHCLAYLLVPPADSGTMHHHMDESHNWFGSMPVLVAAGVTVLAAGLVLCIGEGWRGNSGAPWRPRASSAHCCRRPDSWFRSTSSSSSLPDSMPYELAARADLHHGARASAFPFALGALLLAGGLSTLGYRFGRLLARAIPAGPAVDRQARSPSSASCGPPGSPCRPCWCGRTRLGPLPAPPVRRPRRARRRSRRAEGRFLAASPHEGVPALRRHSGGDVGVRPKRGGALDL